MTLLADKSMNDQKRSPFGTATLLAHGGDHSAGIYGDIVPPVYPGTTFVRNTDYSLKNDQFSYSRSGTPNWAPVEQLLTELEGGHDALLFASGLAAATVIFQTLSPMDHVVIPTAMYHGLRDWLQDFCARWGIGVSEYKAGDLVSLERVLQPGSTKIVWVETPANPTWEITDIKSASGLAHGAGAVCVVDSTVATPILTRPVSLGADFVVHSATKYLNGHSDVLGGIIVAAAESDRWQNVRGLRTGGGAVLGPFESWLLLRGMRTLDIRLERACNNAQRLADHFVSHKSVEAVLYPGLETHPGHEIAARQMSGGFGAMMSILVRGDATRSRKVAGATRIFRPATSLGGVESLIEHRATVEGVNSPVPQNLLRLSIGIETEDDLVDDLEQALSVLDAKHIA